MVNFNTVGCCGLFCEACDIYQSLHNGTLKALAARWRMNPGDVACDGCRTERRSLESRQCFIRKCCLERGLDNCGECADFPCRTLRDFAGGRAPHRSLALENCAFFREVGRFEWYHIQKQKWTCTCGRPFSWYQTKCTACGRDLPNILAGRKGFPSRKEREEGRAAGKKPGGEKGDEGDARELSMGE